MLFKIARMLKNNILILLFAASINLSIHAAIPEVEYFTINKGSVIDELNLLVLPLGERENTYTIQPSFTFLNNSITSALNILSSINAGKAEMELIFKNKHLSFKEYPFIVVIRKLRI